MRHTVREPAGDLLGDARQEGSILFSGPQSHWRQDILKSEAPRLCVNLGVGDEAHGGTAPCSTLTFETCFERQGITQTCRVTGLQQLEQHRANADRETKSSERSGCSKTQTQQ